MEEEITRLFLGDVSRLHREKLPDGFVHSVRVRNIYGHYQNQKATSLSRKLKATFDPCLRCSP